MFFGYSSKDISKATNTIAAGIFIVGMVLIGFGVLIIALPELFALLAAAVFFIIGLSVIGYAIRLFVTIKKMQGMDGNNEIYRENVEIHSPENHID